MAPSEFWSLSPTEFWWLARVKAPQAFEESQKDILLRLIKEGFKRGD